MPTGFPLRRVRRSLLLAAVAMTLAVSAACAPLPPPYEVIPFDWGNTISPTHRDVAYGSHPRQLADLYLSSGERGTIVFLHGGGWVEGDKANLLPSLLLHELRRGYDLVSIEYRLAPKDPFPAAVEDLAMALEWVREEGAALGLSTQKVVVAGHSAGSTIAALGAFGANEDFPGADLPEVDGAVLFSGVYEFAGTPLSPWDSDGWHRDLEGPRGWLRPSGSRSAASAVRWLDAADPETLLVHGGQDPIVLLDQAHALAHRADRVGHGARMRYVEVSSHAFEERCRGHEPWCGTPVATMDDFLDRVAR